ncbi:uncharacterized protein LACBIDRAFT_301607 [Laccaria bicolor S238N-H82]|uniref:Predicted protein n=1 Tax=Laccaria bicolor (strain S238N-H82 / ATCC MYA-4686) TaxID=486041 RepID=B0CNW8_LACBS|nr:uncharacterized protein LACBIDRAFT_301607 [Laccaria bicolor S238N-H82]EDR16016.1 predicted protein [Laccaria bicolor S238N-H82]|eukprot:XP_001874224.1 predicted protein [Laccaria bicolor S238N-H82]
MWPLAKLYPPPIGPSSQATSSPLSQKVSNASVHEHHQQSIALSEYLAQTIHIFHSSLIHNFYASLYIKTSSCIYIISFGFFSFLYSQPHFIDHFILLLSCTPFISIASIPILTLIVKLSSSIIISLLIRCGLFELTPCNQPVLYRLSDVVIFLPHCLLHTTLSCCRISLVT